MSLGGRANFLFNFGTFYPPAPPQLSRSFEVPASLCLFYSKILRNVGAADPTVKRVPLRPISKARCKLPVQTSSDFIAICGHKIAAVSNMLLDLKEGGYRCRVCIWLRPKLVITNCLNYEWLIYEFGVVPGNLFHALAFPDSIRLPKVLPPKVLNPAIITGLP